MLIQFQEWFPCSKIEWPCILKQKNVHEPREIVVKHVEWTEVLRYGPSTQLWLQYQFLLVEHTTSLIPSFVTLQTLQDLLRQAKAGKPIAEDDIPPPVAGTSESSATRAAPPTPAPREAPPPSKYYFCCTYKWHFTLRIILCNQFVSLILCGHHSWYTSSYTNWCVS